jgi:hypothetical protein
MPEDEGYTEGLTGEEIILDVLDQLDKKLHTDCNLRETDAYPGGYDGWIEYFLRPRGLDTVEVRSKIIVGSPALSGQVKKVVEGRIDIPLETSLNVVRERSSQGVPTLSKDENGQPIVVKRQYRRRNVETTAVPEETK